MNRKVSKVDGLSKNFIPLFVLLALASCSLNKSDPNATPSSPTSTLIDQKNETKSMILYFPKTDSSGLVKMQMQTDGALTNITQTIEQIVLGLSQTKDSSQYSIFPEKIEVYGVFVDKDVLYIDFAAGIRKAVFSNIQMEQMALEAFLSTIKVNLPEIAQVKILADHEDTQTVFGHTYAQQPFSLKDL